MVLVVKNLPANAGEVRDTSSVPGLGKSPRGGNGNPFQYSCLENPLDRGVWCVAVHGVTKSWTWLSNYSRKTSASALLIMPKPLTVWITANCRRFFKRWEYQTTLPASWEICMQFKKQQLEPNMEWHGFNWERNTSRRILSPCLFNLYEEYIMHNARLDEAQAGIKIARRNI